MRGRWVSHDPAPAGGRGRAVPPAGPTATTAPPAPPSAREPDVPSAPAADTSGADVPVGGARTDAPTASARRSAEERPQATTVSIHAPGIDVEARVESPASVRDALREAILQVASQVYPELGRRDGPPERSEIPRVLSLFADLMRTISPSQVEDLRVVLSAEQQKSFFEIARVLDVASDASNRPGEPTGTEIVNRQDPEGDQGDDRSSSDDGRGGNERKIDDDEEEDETSAAGDGAPRTAAARGAVPRVPNGEARRRAETT